MNTALRFRGGDALNPMDAAFVLKPLIHISPRDLEDNFLESSQIGGTGIQVFKLPAARFRIVRVHPIEIGREKGGFLSAGASSNFNNSVSRIGRIGRQKAGLNILGEPAFLRFQARHFFIRHLRQLGIRRLGLEERAVLSQMADGFEVGLSLRDQLFEPRVFPG